MSKEKLEEMKRARKPPNHNKFLRNKETIPTWNKKYKTNTIEVGIVIDKALYQWMAVSIK